MAILDIDSALALRHRDRQAHSRWAEISGGQNGEAIGSDFFRPRLTKPFLLDRAAAGYVLGSCFAQEVQFALGRRGVPLRSAIVDAPQQSWFLQDGNQSHYWPLHFFHRFNPVSMRQELENLLSHSSTIPDGELIFERADGSFADYHYDPSFPLPTFRECLERRQFVRHRINALIDVDFVILTLGLIEAWIDAPSGLCLNRPPRPDLIERFPKRFRFRVLDEAEVFATLERILVLLYDANPDLKVVLTVSPVPLIATFTGEDIAVANANSKATLVCAARRVLQSFPGVLYFPSYEIVTHSAREAVWAPDGRHVRAEFVERIMDFFCTEMFSTG